MRDGLRARLPHLLAVPGKLGPIREWKKLDGPGRAASGLLANAFARQENAPRRGLAPRVFLALALSTNEGIGGDKVPKRGAFRRAVAFLGTFRNETSFPDGFSEVGEMTTLPMTTAGYEALQCEMQQRLRVERPHYIERLQQAMTDDGNLSENASYQTIIAEQASNENRIAELEDKLARAEVIDLADQSGEAIRFGATVTLVDEDSRAKKIWQIVGEPEADARRGRISISSPLARALMGRSRGESVEVHAPAGVRSYKVQKVEWSDELR